MLKLHVRIKFRAFLFTFGSWEDDNIPVPLFIPGNLSLPPMPERVLYNNHGVWIAVRVDG